MSKSYLRFIVPKITSSLAICSSIFIYSVMPAQAIFNNYIKQINNNSNIGGYFESSYGQEDLRDNSPNDNSGFINKEMWVDFNSNQTEWIEVGDTKGPTSKNLQLINPTDSQKSYWSGHFLAYNIRNSSTGKFEYHEVAYGNQYPIGVQSYSISYIGSNSWVIYTNFNRILTLQPISYTSANDIQMGIETNDLSDTSFLDNTFASNIQWKDTNGAWRLWNNSTANVDSDFHLPKWYSRFAYDSTNAVNVIHFYNQ